MSVTVGVSIILSNPENDTLILMSKRLGKHENNKYAPCGGHLEFGETIEECAKREAKEELGITIKRVQNLGFTEDFYDYGEERHFITFFVLCYDYEGEIINMEPEKHDKWKWYKFNNLPTPLCKWVENYLNKYESINSKIEK